MNKSRLQILYKHKDRSLGMGMIESANVIRDLKKHLHSYGLIYEDSFLYVGCHNEFYIYSMNFTMTENK